MARYKARKQATQQINPCFPPAQARALRNGIGVEAAYKDTTTARASNAALASDPDLSINVLGDTAYKIEAFLPITTAATPGFQFDFGGGTATVTSFVGTARLDTANAAATASVDVTAITTAVNPTAAAHTRGYYVGTAVFATEGTLVLRWAQNTSNATAAQLLAGAAIIATPIQDIFDR